MTGPALRGSALLPACAVSFLVLASVGPADAADCAVEPQGEGLLPAGIRWARSFRLDDGREVRLVGIEQRLELHSPCGTAPPCPPSPAAAT